MKVNQYFSKGGIFIDTNLTSEILTQKEIQEILHCGKTKLQQLLNSGVLPVTKVGRTYLTTRSALSQFITENFGKEIFY